MLPKSERFTKQDFVGKRPKVFFRGELFDVALVPFREKISEVANPEEHVPSQKFACVTSKKTLKRAVDRNLIKRRLFNGIKEAAPHTEYSFVFYPKKGSDTAPYSQLQTEIKKAFDTLH